MALNMTIRSPPQHLAGEFGSDRDEPENCRLLEEVDFTPPQRIFIEYFTRPSEL
jgi:hypothetical protein